MDAKKNQVSGIKNQKLSFPPQKSTFGLPVCPAGHLVLGTPIQTIILKLIHLQRYEAFCGHCQRRYIVYRWKTSKSKEWRIWRYRTFPGVDGYREVQRPPMGQALVEIAA